MEDNETLHRRYEHTVNLVDRGREQCRQQLAPIIKRLSRARFAKMIYVAEDYSLADLIHDLDQINQLGK